MRVMPSIPLIVLHNLQRAFLYINISGSTFFEQYFISKYTIEVRIFLKICCNFVAATYLADGFNNIQISFCLMSHFRKACCCAKKGSV